MKSLILVTEMVVLLSACSSTIHYEASGFYSQKTTDGQVEIETDCRDAAPDVCERILLRWETERYCGIYRSAPNNVTDESLRVGSSPTTLSSWDTLENFTVLRGDDEDFLVALGSVVQLGTDYLCGQFDPPKNLVDVKAGDKLKLQVFCQPIRSGIFLMPPLESGYILSVEATEYEDSWFGCSK